MNILWLYQTINILQYCFYLRSSENMEFYYDKQKCVDTCTFKGNKSKYISTIYYSKSISNLEYKSFEYEMYVDIGKECSIGFCQNPIKNILGNDYKAYTKSFLYNTSLVKNKAVYGLAFTKNKLKIAYFVKGVPLNPIKLDKSLNISITKIRLIFSIDFDKRHCTVYLNNKNQKLTLNDSEPTFKDIPNNIVPIFSQDSGNLTIVSMKYRRSISTK